jgi:hypothetical protein
MGLEECAVDIKGVAAGVWLGGNRGYALAGETSAKPSRPAAFSSRSGTEVSQAVEAEKKSLLRLRYVLIIPAVAI